MQSSLLTKQPRCLPTKNSIDSGNFKKFILKEKRKIHFFLQNEIERCEAQSNYTKIFFTSGKIKLVSKCLKVIESELSKDLFIRIHAKHLVNRNTISHITISPSKLIHLVNGNSIPIARSKYRAVKNQIQL